MKKSIKVTIGVVSALSALLAVAVWILYKNRKEITTEVAKIPQLFSGGAAHRTNSRCRLPAQDGQQGRVRKKAAGGA